MDFFEYLEPVSYRMQSGSQSKLFLGDYIVSNLGEERGFIGFEGFHAALIGIPEERGTGNKGCAQAPAVIREELYHLSWSSEKIRIVDLGDLRPGNTLEDTYFGITYIINELLQQNIIPIILGGSSDLCYSIYCGFSGLRPAVNMVEINSGFEMSYSETEYSYLEQIFISNGPVLANFTNIGYQSYNVTSQHLEFLRKLNFDLFRLGRVRESIDEAEPSLRDADMVYFHIASVKQADAPGYHKPHPNGFTADEACQLARYAGMSDRCNLFGLFNVNPIYDVNRQTASLAAQVLWHFLEGIALRKAEFPADDHPMYIKYSVQMNDFDDDIIFYKSAASGRWWMQVNKEDKITENEMIACSVEDYEKARNNEIPDRLWRHLQRRIS